MRQTLSFVLRPSRVLGLLICLEAFAFGLFVQWVNSAHVFDWEVEAPANWSPQHWLLSISAFLAMVGWTVSAMVTVKNSVKQHTINTLLQSRLSVEYMKHASVVNQRLSQLLAKDPEVPDIFSVVASDKEHLQYILNYLEFIAVGVRHGDLHEPLLRSSLRGILCGTFECAKPWIVQEQAKQPSVFENLIWLQNRWKRKATRPKLKSIPYSH